MGQRKLLIVDDEPKIRAMLADCLQQTALAIATAESGEEALAKLAQDPPDVMILDVKMKGMSGVEVLRQVRASFPHIGVLIITGFDDERVEQDATRLGVLGVIHKPLMLSEVRQTIHEALATSPPF
jgi:two-component system response regulator (stage 0 sporulation protein F)